MTDSKRLKQIIFNLVGNSIKFTTKGRISIKVSHYTEESSCNEKEIFNDCHDRSSDIMYN